MAVIYTPRNYQQIYNSMESYLVSVASGFTNFNVGSRIRTLLEAVALVSGQTHFIFYQALQAAIPTSLYEGFGFTKKAGDKASGTCTMAVDEAVTGDTLYPSGILITANGNDYESTLHFVIKDGETQNGIIIPFEISGGLSDQGGWNAITNTPAIPAASPSNLGHYYEVTTADPDPDNNTEIDGIKDWEVGDWVMSTGSIWMKGEPGGVPMLSTEIGASQDLAALDIDTQSGLGAFKEDYGLDWARNDAAISGGSDEESDDSRRIRFFSYVNGLTRTNNAGILAAALSVAGVQSAYLLENYPDNGWLRLFIDDGTGSVNPTIFAEVRKLIEGDPNDPENYPGYRAAGISLEISAPNAIVIDISFLLYIDELTQEAATDIENIAVTAVERYINSLKMGYDVILTEIITVIQNSHPDIIDVDITEIKKDTVVQPIDNVEIEFDEVAKIGTVTPSHVLIPKV